MRINRITLSLACVLATGPCLAGSTEASVQGHDVDGLPAAGTAAFVLIDGVADSDKLPGSLLLDFSARKSNRRHRSQHRPMKSATPASAFQSMPENWTSCAAGKAQSTTTC
jgi:hypothetical protein